MPDDFGGFLARAFFLVGVICLLLGLSNEVFGLDWWANGYPYLALGGDHIVETRTDGELGFTDELTAYQLGHADAKLVRDLYGHGRADALDRLKRGSRVEVRPIRATSLPHAVGEPA